MAIGSHTEVVTPCGWLPIARLSETPAFVWSSIDCPPKERKVGIKRRVLPLLHLEARSGAVVETTPDHDLRVVSQMTGDQVISHREVARRMRESSSYKRKSIYSFPEALPTGLGNAYPVLPKLYRDSAAYRVAASMPYLTATNAFNISIRLQRTTSQLERKCLLDLFARIGLKATVDGQIDRPFLRVELRGGGGKCPDLMLARYAGDEMRGLFSILFEFGSGSKLTDAQRGWWHMMSAHLGLRVLSSGDNLKLLRHRRHSLRCPEGGLGRRACFDVETEGLPMLMTRINGSAPVLVPVR